MNITFKNALAAQSREATLPQGTLVDDLNATLDAAIRCIRGRDDITAIRYLEGLKGIFLEASPFLNCRGKAVQDTIRYMALTKYTYELEVLVARKGDDAGEAMEFVRKRTRDIEEIDHFLQRAVINSINYLDPQPVGRD